MVGLTLYAKVHVIIQIEPPAFTTDGYANQIVQLICFKDTQPGIKLGYTGFV
jgi:hypothetical protein